MDNKFLISFIVVFVVVVLGIAFLTNKDGGQSIPPEQKIADHVLGNGNAKIKLVEYSDFQCPACAAYEPIVKQILDEYGSEILFTYRHFPLRLIHPHAQLAAQAAEAAGLHGAFWEMHDKLFENQETWSSQRNIKSTLFEYAEEIGLNVDRFEVDLTSAEVKDKVDRDFEAGNQAGVNGTPTFYLNGTKIEPRSLEEFKELIETELDK